MCYDLCIFEEYNLYRCGYLNATPDDIVDSESRSELFLLVRVEPQPTTLVTHSVLVETQLPTATATRKSYSNLQTLLSHSFIVNLQIIKNYMYNTICFVSTATILTNNSLYLVQYFHFKVKSTLLYSAVSFCCF